MASKNYEVQTTCWNCQTVQHTALPLYYEFKPYDPMDTDSDDSHYVRPIPEKERTDKNILGFTITHRQVPKRCNNCKVARLVRSDSYKYKLEQIHPVTKINLDKKVK